MEIFEKSKNAKKGSSGRNAGFQPAVWD